MCAANLVDAAALPASVGTDASKQNVVVFELLAQDARARGDEVTARQAEEGLKVWVVHLAHAKRGLGT